VNPHLFTVRVLESWGIVGNITSEFFVGNTDHLVYESIEVDDDKVRSGNHSWGSGHGKVKSGLVVRSKWNLEVHWSFVGDHGVKVLDNVVEVSLSSWNNDTLDDLVDDGRAKLDERIKDRIVR